MSRSRQTYVDFASLTFSSTGNTLEDVLQTLAELDEADCCAFPYEDIRHIYRTVTSRKIVTRRAIAKGFIPDWNTFAMTASGYSSWGEKSLIWPAEKRQRIAKYLGKSFFERYLEYLPICRWITSTDTPELFRDFVLHEEMRVNVLALLRLLDELESQQHNGN